MGTVVLDASIVIGLFDPSDALHPGAVLAIHDVPRTDSFVMPASVLSEVLVGAASRGDLGAILRLVTDAFGPVRPLDEDVAVAAARRRARHPRIRLPDALVLATADVESADTVLTGDRRWAALDHRVVVVAGRDG